MRNKIIILFFFIAFLGFQFQLIAQLTSKELTEREKWEEFLETAEIVESSASSKLKGKARHF